MTLAVNALVCAADHKELPARELRDKIPESGSPWALGAVVKLPGCIS